MIAMFAGNCDICPGRAAALTQRPSPRKKIHDSLGQPKPQNFHGLNIWKQELCANIVNDLFKALFPKSSITKELNEEYANVIDPTFKNFINFKEICCTVTTN